MRAMWDTRALTPNELARFRAFLLWVLTAEDLEEIKRRAQRLFDAFDACEELLRDEESARMRWPRINEDEDERSGGR